MYNELQERLNYKFKDDSLLLNALTHKSYSKKKSNERLEFLGDAVLDLIVAEFLYTKFKQHDEGQLSRLRASMVNKKSFQALAKNIDMGKYIRMSQSEEKNNGKSKTSILSDAFEALMGAIYLDGGLDKLKTVFLKLLTDEYKDISLESLSQDYKSKLQEITHAKLGVTPIYKLDGQNGPDHNKEFEVSVWIDDKYYAKSIARSKKLAEQKASKRAIELLNTQK